MRSHAPISGGPASFIWLGVLLLFLFAALVIAYVNNPTHQTGPEIDEVVFAQRLRSISGPGAIDCGFVRIDQDTTRETSCRDNALEQRQPFYYAFKREYFRWWLGLAMDPEGNVWIVEFDHESPEAGTIRIGPCRPRTLGAKFTCGNWNE